MSGLLTPQVAIIALAILVTLSVGGVAYALFFNRVRGPSNIARRVENIAVRAGAGASAARLADAAAKRRKSVQDTLHEMEVREKARAASRSSPPLQLRIEQAGLEWTKRKFYVVGLIAGVVALVIGLYTGIPIYATAGFAAAGALGFPYWMVNFLRKRRFKAFTKEFPNSVDVIVRGVKAGLPLNDCFRIVANESQEPVRSEFRLLHERQSLGQTMAEAVAGLPERVPLPEASFFAIAITIQQQTGGNLSEVLGNLSKVLRERAKMKGKVKAMSMEAKASAWIIGSLPVIVMLLVYLTSPDYIILLFTEQVGNVILLASAFWMACGVFVMRRMINFDI